MLNVIKVILFVIVNIAGWFTIAIIANMAYKIGFLPELPPGIHLETFKFWFLGIGTWVWIACAVISISYFFLENEWKNWILLAPMFVTGIYGLAVLVYFNFFYTIT